MSAMSTVVGRKKRARSRNSPSLGVGPGMAKAANITAGTPAPIVARLSQALQQVLAEPALVAQLRRIGFNAAPMAAPAFGAFQRAEVARWRDLVELTGIRIEG